MVTSDGLVVEALSLLGDRLSSDVLNAQYEKFLKAREEGVKLSDRAKKILAEMCYLLAQQHMREGDVEKAVSLGNEAVELYRTVRTEALEDCAPELWMHLPDIMHEGVVKERVLRQQRLGQER